MQTWPTSWAGIVCISVQNYLSFPFASHIFEDSGCQISRVLSRHCLRYLLARAQFQLNILLNKPSTFQHGTWGILLPWVYSLQLIISSLNPQSSLARRPWARRLAFCSAVTQIELWFLGVDENNLQRSLGLSPGNSKGQLFRSLFSLCKTQTLNARWLMIALIPSCRNWSSCQASHLWDGSSGEGCWLLDVDTVSRCSYTCLELCLE